ncbi:piggyBac transposable element-derived protein 3-like [Schistocerca serialis cubense]|uniref:piggyBac transposable element-derived protein 3-like n=1 Tax=Schistocerca serialis cubense TaxID=2023355 RepID=UPI00214E6615|nr:piggyBac transposable element-derived protein 3-like [Schistocerca serialis cubense]
MIPFTGQVRTGQYVRGEPHPVGLKNFVLATSNGIPLDFLLYQGKGKDITSGKIPVPDNLHIGGHVVLKLSDSLPPGSLIYIDRYFTSVPFLDSLLTHGPILAIGTIVANHLPKTVNFKRDLDMKREGTGSFDQVVRSDQKIAAMKWFDNKPTYVASSAFGVHPTVKFNIGQRKIRFMSEFIGQM